MSGSSTVEVWGTGTPRREFLYVDDLADAAVFALLQLRGRGTPERRDRQDITIRELAELIAETVGWSGELVFDTSMPDGMPRKLLDVSKLAKLGWSAHVELGDGLRRVYRSFLAIGESADAPARD